MLMDLISLNSAKSIGQDKTTGSSAKDIVLQEDSKR